MEALDTGRVPHHSDHGSWELAVGAPDPRLREQVSAYFGYREQGPGSVRRREVATSDVVLIINFGPAWRLLPVLERARGRGPVELGSFVGGVADAYTLTESPGMAHCLQVNFTPLGAYQFFGVPMEELANRAIAFDDLAGDIGRDLPERLYLAPSWAARFDILDRVIAERLAKGPAIAPAIAWAWRELHRTGGGRRIGDLAQAIGWSRKHLNQRFREQVGSSPKTMARLLRFHRALRRLDPASPESLIEIAYACGYYDQAHFIRDFRAFAGTTPGEFLRHRLAETNSSRDDDYALPAPR